MVDVVDVQQSDPHVAASVNAVDHAGAEHTAVVEQHGGASHAGPTWLGFDASGWVAVAMLILIGVMLWKKVPQLIGQGLDGYASKIKAELDEAARLRKEAEDLLANYQAQAKQATADAAAILANAATEAQRVVADAKAQAEETVARRTRMAEEKITSAERNAVDALKAQAAELAVSAAEKILLTKTDSAVQQRLTEEAISELDRRLH